MCNIVFLSYLLLGSSLAMGNFPICLLYALVILINLINVLAWDQIQYHLLFVKLFKIKIGTLANYMFKLIRGIIKSYFRTWSGNRWMHFKNKLLGRRGFWYTLIWIISTLNKIKESWRLLALLLAYTFFSRIITHTYPRTKASSR